MVESSEQRNEGRIDRLLKEISELKGPIERTLMDVREILAAVDSPLRAVPTVQPQQRSERTGKEAPAKPQEATRDQNNRAPAAEASVPAATGFDVLTFNAFAMTELLVKLLGKWHLERLIMSLGRDEAVKESLRKALESITATEPIPDHPPLGVAPRDAVQAGVVLLSLLFENPRNPAIGILAQSLDKLLSPYLVKR
ncbi:MAG: hypothetical protein QW490_05110 [Nitrososphaerota archaeon]